MLEAQSPRESPARITSTAHSVAWVGAWEPGMCEQKPTLLQVATGDSVEDRARG